MNENKKKAKISKIIELYLKTCDYEIKHFANCMKENYNKYYEQKVRD